MAHIKPIPFSTLIREGYSVEDVGSKALSLARLYDAHFMVPDAWVIPCSYTKKRGELHPDWGLAYYPNPYWKYAVRSGAPVSMPGILETKLNVPWDGLQQAIEDVWDSWNSEHAKAYRKAKGLPDSLGTGVIIQKMVEDIDISGVAFTADPNNPDKRFTFDPIIEYVKGTGDTLVGGTAKPKKLYSTHPSFPYLRGSLERLHNEFGPSDVEYVISYLQDTYFVQQRPLKFSEAAKTGPKLVNGVDALALGTPVGSPVSVSVPLVLVHSSVKPEDVAGKAVYIDEFRPQYYPLMISAAAIVCGVGGTTCHASILARDMGKPAVSDISVDDAIRMKTQKAVLIDGQTGQISRAEKADKIEAPTVLVKRRFKEHRTPDLKVKKHGNFQVEKLLYRFYYTVEQKRLGKLDASEAAARFDEIAKILSTYFYVATISEARHVRNHTKASKSRTKLISELVRRGINIPLSTGNPDDIISRERFEPTIPQPQGIREAAAIAGHISRLFNELRWTSSGFGGTKWGEIADTLLQYLNGKVSPEVFCDMVFNLEHNGGSAFGKFPWLKLSTHPGTFKSLLSAKAIGFEQLTARFEQILAPSTGGIFDDSYSYRKYFGDYKEFAQKERILVKVETPKAPEATGLYTNTTTTGTGHGYSWVSFDEFKSDDTTTVLVA